MRKLKSKLNGCIFQINIQAPIPEETLIMSSFRESVHGDHGFEAELQALKEEMVQLKQAPLLSASFG
jgi:hypothetical protein